MRILANENVPLRAIERLRAAGHDVAWVHDESPGASDEANLARAGAEQRLLATFDKDFGELVFRRGRAAPAGVVLFRLSMPGAESAARRILEVLESRTDWAGHFSVVEDAFIRMVPLERSE